MKDEEINRAIAEACGWKRVTLGTQSRFDKEPRGWLSPKHESWNCAVGEPPNYTKSLNACHEMELQLKGGRQDEHSEVSAYIENLTSVCADCLESTWDWDLIHATARQRAEAFLRTIGKWKAQ